MLMCVDLHSLQEVLTICSAGHARVSVCCVVTAMRGVVASVRITWGHERVRKLQDLLAPKSSTEALHVVGGLEGWNLIALGTLEVPELVCRGRGLLQAASRGQAVLPNGS